MSRLVVFIVITLIKAKGTFLGADDYKRLLFSGDEYLKFQS